MLHAFWWCAGRLIIPARDTDSAADMGASLKTEVLSQVDFSYALIVNDFLGLAESQD